jgi:hypothetical protein
MKKYFIVVFMTMFAFYNANAQRMSLTSGSLDFLKGQKEIKIEFKYDITNVGDLTEQEYIDKKTKESEEKKVGSGKEWKEKWIANRKAMFEPKFLTLFNKVISDIDVKQSDAAKYVLIVNTVFIEPGFNVGVMRRPSFIDCDLIFKEVATGKELAVIAAKNAPGQDAMGFDYDAAYRISEAYAKCGKTTANYLIKKGM